MTSPSLSPLQAAHCPLCGQANQCALAEGRPSEQCWCMAAVLNREALQALPAAVRGTRCICAVCGQQPMEQTGSDAR